MNENDFDLAARAWLDDGPTQLSDRALLSALEEIHTTRQRRAMRPAWRALPMSNLVRVATAAVLVVVVGLLVVNVVPRQPDGSSVGGESPSPTPAQALGFPELTKTFVSPLNGFSINHPENAAITPAAQIWGFANGAVFSNEDVDDEFDVIESGLDAVFKGASTRDGISGDDPIDKEIEEWFSADNILPGGCGVPRSQQAEITIDGRSGRIAECANRLEATVVAAGRLYLFMLEHDRSDARAVFDAFLATIDLTPETAVNEPTSTRTFVSPTYGYSFKYDRGAIAPAAVPWDPDDQPLADTNFDRRFDGLETGYGAYFEGASTPIPDGVSIDEWVDEYVTPVATFGCFLPRSWQTEITIDGRPGRIAQCPDQILATVVDGGRLYLFILSHSRSRDDARALFDAWAATIDLRPEDAAQPSTRP